jgi:hypothetical protein
MIALLHRDRANPTPALRGCMVFVGSAMAPVAVAVLAFSGPLGATGALRAVGIGAIRLLGDDLTALPFYQRGMGTDDVFGNLAVAVLWAARLGGLFAPFAVAALLLGAKTSKKPWIAGLGFLAMALVLAPFADGLQWLQAARPLPFFGLFALIYCAARLARPSDRERASRGILQAMLVAFGTVLLAKIFLLARIYQYGFVLGLPAALLFVAALVSWIPGEIRRRGGSAALFRGAAVGFLAVAVFGHLVAMAPYLNAKTGRVGGVHDSIRVAPGIARMVGRTLEAVHARTAPNDTLAVLPEGVMLNFLARRPTPTPHFSFNPFELHVYGESEILRGFEASPPAAIVLVHHDTSEHGARFLGANYGLHLMSWVRSRYRTAVQIGDPPLRPGTRFGIAVLEPGPAP